MVIDSSNSHATDHVKFISYTGKWPNLCDGLLTLEIDNEKVTFGSVYMYEEAQYDKFWSSGGRCSIKCIETSEWCISEQKLPERFRKYAEEIDDVFNTNVEYGCCGGCR